MSFFASIYGVALHLYKDIYRYYMETILSKFTIYK